MIGTANDRTVKGLQSFLVQINSLEEEIQKKTDDELKEQTNLFKQRLENGEPLDSLIPETFAIVREVSKRVHNMRHFDVQIIGGIALHRGMIAEMRTGEGKTLVATAPLYLNALSGKGVHLITVNDYLAERDSSIMSKIYNFLGLSCGCIVHDLTDAERQEEYAKDITYGTNNEFGFDYLRDNMKFHLKELVQRPFNYVIIDEVDSILIDEARTPLIISGASDHTSDLYIEIDKVIPYLRKDVHYKAEEKDKSVAFTEDGLEKVEESLRTRNLLKEGTLFDRHNLKLMHYLNQALKAHIVFHRDIDYIIKDDKVVLIDEFTGRMMDGRRYSDGLHQALEAKEKVEIQPENQTLASITFQNYFRLYPKLAGMTGTAITEATEFLEIYKLSVVAIPSNVPTKRIDHQDEIYRTDQEKFDAIAKLIQECRERKQPVLVGTVSIEKSEYLARLLRKKKIPHQVLNARYHEHEAMIIADAGRPGAVTIATNMAGRGTDIKLGGNVDSHISSVIANLTDPEEIQQAIVKVRQEIEEQAEIARQAGGLFVIGTERHESRRIDNQLRGRSARQSDPGASKFFLSLEDDLMRIFGVNQRLDGVLGTGSMKEGEALTHTMISKAIASAQKRVEGRNYDIRKHVLKYDDIVNEQRKVIYEQRRDFMHASDISDEVNNIISEVVQKLIKLHIPPRSYVDLWDLDGLEASIKKLVGNIVDVKALAQEDGIAEKELSDTVIEKISAFLKNKEQSYGSQMMRHMEKTTMLRVLDNMWRNHLYNLDHIRQGIQLRTFAQRDPLNEYKTESFHLFATMLDAVKEEVLSSLCNFELGASSLERLMNFDSDMLEDLLAEKAGLLTDVEESQTNEDDLSHYDSWSEVSRNAPCPCGSGERYKFCHGKITS